MRGRTSVLLLSLALLSVPGPVLGVIYEYADADGKVKYYKYTGKDGVVVMTDRLAGIPDEAVRRDKIVRIAPPARSASPAESSANASASSPEAGSLATSKATEEGGSATGQKAMLAGIAALLATVAGVGVVAKRRGASRQPLGRPGAHGPRASRTDSAASATKKAPPANASDGGTLPRKRCEMPAEALKRYLAAWDFASAAKLCESLGRLAEAARYHLQAGNAARARELYVHLAEYDQAAELFEKAGDVRKAAELYEAQSVKLREAAGGSAGRESALKSGRLFESIGDADHALAVYGHARCFLEAAAIHESRGDLLKAAECFLEAEELETAAEYFGRAGASARGHKVLSRFLYEQGRVSEAAAHAEWAGDTVEAATMFQEAGEPARAGGLFLKAGFFHEAADNLLQAGETAGAAEAFELAGKHREAGQALEACGGDRRRIEELYRKSGDFGEVGRFLFEHGELDAALSALQQVDPASEQYPQASLLVGRVFLDRGMTAQAIEKFSKVIGDRALDKSSLDPYYYLALCHEAAGDGRSARSILTRILAEDYNFRDVRERVSGC